MWTEHLAIGLILLFAVGLLLSEILWRGEGYRLWLGIVLVVVSVIARRAHLFRTS